MDYSTDRWYGNLQVKGLDEHFRADLGYIPEIDKQQLSNRIEYHRWADDDDETIQYLEIGSSQLVKYDFRLEELLEYYINPMLGCNFAFNLSIWTGFEYSKIEENGPFEISANWLNIDFDPIRQLSLGVNLVKGKDIAWFIQEPEESDLDKIDVSLKIKPNSFIDLEVNSNYHDLDSYYIARSLEAKCKLQFHKNFWMRMIVHYQNTDIISDDEKIERFDIYPLFTYKPSSDIALYLGASDSKMETSQNRDIINYDVSDVTYYLKISYAIKLI